MRTKFINYKIERKEKTMEEKTIKTKLKKAVIILLPVVFALVAALAVALMVGGSLKKAEGGAETPESTEPPRDSDVQVIAPIESEGNGEYSRGLEYRSNGDGTCAVSGIGSCADRTVIIPTQSPAGDMVTAIGYGAFENVKAIGEVVMPDSVMTIGERAFRGSGIISANIGNGVISIGDQAFSKCASLTAINVGSANAMYASKNGVLFNREMTTLICYPSGKADRAYSIPSSVTRISSAAFSECLGLREISFGGTKKQWASVYVCSENDSLDSSYISFAPEEK
jgi:hypothetical protein